MINSVKQPCDEGVIRSTPCQGQGQPKNRGRWILAATILGSSMSFIDGTVVNVALPALQTAFNATEADVQWVVEAYALLLAALILVGGALGDMFGRKRIFVLGVALFALSSLACGLSQSLLQLIISRAIQGIGGALLVPGSLAIISASFDQSRRGQAIGTWSGFTSITSSIGPVLGGWLVQFASWRWVFFINLPLATIVLLLTLWRVPESRGSQDEVHLDWSGAVSVTLGLAGIVYGLIEASALGFGNPQVLLALIAGVVFLVIFLVVEQRSRAPMVPLSLFHSRTFSGANILTFLLYSGLSGALYFIPFYLIQVQGYGATAAGASLLPFVLLMFLLSRWTGGLVSRYGSKIPLIIGPFIAACGFTLFAILGHDGSYWTTIFPAIVVLGTGMSISVAPLTTTIMNAVDEKHAGIASGINNAVSRTAGLLSIATLGIVIVSVFSIHLQQQLANLSLPSSVKNSLQSQQAKLAGIRPPANLSSATQHAIEQAVKSSFINGFHTVMLCSAGLALLSTLGAILFIEGKGKSQ